MKRVIKPSLALITLGLLLSACGKEESATPAVAPAPTATPAPAAAPAAPATVAAPADAKPQADGDLGAIGADGMPLLARKSNCTACHTIDKKMLGPTWMEVSRKYKGADSYEFQGKKYSVEAGLVAKVSKGGSGVWGTMPMPPNAPSVKDEDIKALVHFVLGLAK